MASDFSEMPRLAKQLIDDEMAVRKNDSLNWGIVNPKFLFGLTNYDQLNEDWAGLVADLTNPSNDPSLQFVIKTLTETAA